MVGLISSSMIIATILTAVSVYLTPVALSIQESSISHVYIGSTSGLTVEEVDDDEIIDEVTLETSDEDTEGVVDGVVVDGSEEVLSVLDGTLVAEDTSVVVEELISVLVGTFEEETKLEFTFSLVDDDEGAELLVVGGNGTTISGESPIKSLPVWSSSLSGMLFSGFDAVFDGESPEEESDEVPSESEFEP